MKSRSFLRIACVFSVVLMCISYYASAWVSKRHDLVDGKLMVAYHIALPGYDRAYEPEYVVDLKKWAGSSSRLLTAVNGDGTTNDEVNAGIALRQAGLFSDCQLEQNGDGHYILHKKARRSDPCFTWHHWYRIGPWSDDKS